MVSLPIFFWLFGLSVGEYISIKGAYQPTNPAGWRSMYNLGLNRKLMFVEVTTAPKFEAGVPRPLFRERVYLGLPASMPFATLRQQTGIGFWSTDWRMRSQLQSRSMSC
jgi:hypothetical protein